MDIGFTGTRHGMSIMQSMNLQRLFNMIKDEDVSFHHGQCVGSDAEAAKLAYETGFRIISHPGYLKNNPLWRGSRSVFDKNHVILQEKPFLDRDKDIVNASEILFATPHTNNEMIRSGTWTTTRYAIRNNKLVIRLNPDGSMVSNFNGSVYDLYL